MSIIPLTHDMTNQEARAVQGCINSYLQSGAQSLQSGLSTQTGRVDSLVSTSSNSFYQKCASSDTGALLVVSSGATTGQINLASVTPAATGYTPAAGDYVRLVYGVAAGSAELIDARISADGRIKNNVGNNVRDIGNNVSNIESAYMIKSKNLIGTSFMTGAIYSNNGNLDNGSSFQTWQSTDFIAIKPNAKYKLSYQGAAANANTGAYYDANKVYISGFSGCSDFTSPANAYFIRFSQSNTNPFSSNWQFEEGTAITLYHAPNYTFPFASQNFVYCERVECDNKLGAYIDTTWHDNSPTGGVSGYITKVFYVKDINFIVLSGTISAYTNAYTLLDENKNILSYHKEGSSAKTYSNYSVDTTGACYIAISSLGSNWSPYTNCISIYGYKKRSSSKWAGKKIIWFGTSIPAGGYKGNDDLYSYPKVIGKITDSTVANEAIGSSGVHCKCYARISANNPYGFIDNLDTCCRCLTNTVAEMDWIYDHCQDTNVFPTTGRALTAQEKSDAESFSYENKLDQYLTDSTFPDMFVFDHGYNDFGFSDFSNEANEQIYDSMFATLGRHNLYTFRGAMNFLIDRILSFRPTAKIVMIGAYDAQLPAKALVSKYQQIVAQDYEMPLLDLWNKTGWSQKQVTVNGSFDANGIWNETSTPQTSTILNLWLPDNTHPHSNRSGKAIMHLVNIILPFLESL